ncbi:MAG: DedA family protein [Hyphomicrobiales bacterium]|nr:DedA family protein [Hyphomicrobiales bacterium]
MIDPAVYGALFLAAFLAATILPMQSEALLVGALLAGNQPAWALVLCAGVGNVLGSIVNWFLGRGIERFRHHRWFPVKEADLAQAQTWYRRWGKWSLLLSWAPIVGDPLTVVAGLLREPLAAFVVLVAVAKFGRYVALAAATLAWA